MKNEKEFWSKKEAKEYLAEINLKGANAKLYLKRHTNKFAVEPITFTYIVKDN